MNAIAYSPRHGITDPYGGREDTAKGIIRAVGEPELRFTEDALRILRGVRFSGVLGFEIEEKTAEAMLETRRLLKNVSVERIYVELKKLISGKYSYEVLGRFSEIILDVIPEISGLNLPEKSLYDSADFTARLLSLFYLNSPSPSACFETAMKRLHTDSHIRELGAKVLSKIDSANTKTDVGLKYLLRDVGEECAIALTNAKILLRLDDESVRERLTALLDSGAVCKLSDLRINGKTLGELGVKGKRIGEILSSLLGDVIEGKIENTADELLSAAKKML
jgi:tRNA nucleotidyltransferase (CCA-adding enzyme)